MSQQKKEEQKFAGILHIPKNRKVSCVLLYMRILNSYVV